MSSAAFENLPIKSDVPGISPANKPVLTVVPHYRFKSLDDYIRDTGGKLYYGAGRRSFDFGVHIGVFKQGLGKVALREEEKQYDKWKMLSKGEILANGLKRIRYDQDDIISKFDDGGTEMVEKVLKRAGISPAQLTELRELQDPAVHEMDELVAWQKEELPEVTREHTRHLQASTGFVIVLASIHG